MTIAPITKHYKIAKKNLDLIYNNMSFNEKRLLLRSIFFNMGMFIGEFPHIRQMSEKNLNERVNVIGIENLQHCKESKIPFIIICAHTANWEIVLPITKNFYDRIGLVYRHANNKYMENLINNSRNLSHINLIPKGRIGAKKMAETISQRNSIIMLVDQKMNNGIKSELLGVECMTTSSPAKIALKYGYKIIPARCVRIGKTSYFNFIIDKPIDINYQDSGDENIENITRDIDKLISNWINHEKSQWLWMHDRWGQ